MKISILTAVLALGLILPVLTYAKEEKVKLSDCPEKETKKDGTVVYEAEIKKDGKEIEVEVAADGTLIKVEQEDDDDDKYDDNDDD
jgi:uncharacterized membrane protein YkoI